jgi:hypothetical protein
MKWMKNSKGKEDFALTMAFVSFCVVSFVIVGSLLKGVTTKVLSFELNQPDTTLLSMYLATCFGSYITRRYHSDKQDMESKKNGENT